jgi:hypothetical protein
MRADVGGDSSTPRAVVRELVAAHQVEAFVLEAIERVLAGHPIEDATIECKTTWPAPHDAARRIAGHANAARGRQIVWIIGVNEKSRSVAGASPVELATWWAQVRSQFDEGWAPELTGNYAIPLSGRTIIALVFATGRAPFIVRNPRFGRTDAIQFEVPWREATGIRSASRAQLLRILSPLQDLPEIDVLGARLTARVDLTRAGPGWDWNLRVMAYIAPRTAPIWIPFHRCRATIDVSTGRAEVEFSEVSMRPRTRWAIGGSVSAGAFDTIPDSDTVLPLAVKPALRGLDSPMSILRSRPHQ